MHHSKTYPLDLKFTGRTIVYFSCYQKLSDRLKPSISSVKSYRELNY